MRNKLFLLFFLLLASFASFAQSIQIYCPSKITFTAQSQSWATYKYNATTPVDLPPINNQIELSGEGNAAPSTAPILQSATWSDGTFVCNYAGKSATGISEGMALYEGVLYRYVENCFFPGHLHDCHISNNTPSTCPLACELSSENKS